MFVLPKANEGLKVIQHFCPNFSLYLNMQIVNTLYKYTHHNTSKNGTVSQCCCYVWPSLIFSHSSHCCCPTSAPSKQKPENWACDTATRLYLRRQLVSLMFSLCVYTLPLQNYILMHIKLKMTPSVKGRLKTNSAATVTQVMFYLWKSVPSLRKYMIILRVSPNNIFSCT